MYDVTRERIRRKLEVLPDEQLYQVLDFIEFLESKYAAGRAPEPSGLQRFAERLEDRLRARSIAPWAMGGALKLVGTAGRLVDGMTQAGRDLLAAAAQPAPADRAAREGDEGPPPAAIAVE